MNTLKSTLDTLKEKKAAYENQLSALQTNADETTRLESLLEATKNTLQAVENQRREFISGGGDIFDSKAKKLRKEAQESASLVDDLMFSIDAHQKRRQEIIIEASSAYNAASTAQSACFDALMENHLEKALESPPVGLFIAAHIAANQELKNQFSAEVYALSGVRLLMQGNNDNSKEYQDMLFSKLHRIILGKFSDLMDRQILADHLDAKTADLLNVGKFSEYMSTAKIHMARESQKLKQRDASGADHDEYAARSPNLVLVR